MRLQQKGPGVYYMSNNTKLDDKGIKWLEEKMIDENLSLARVCLHEDVDSELMAMVIVIKNRYTYPAHRHTWKDECYNIIKGSCNYVEYSNNGKIIATHELETGCTFLNRQKRFHTLVPTSDILVFLETTTGPFISSRELEFL